ncbi:hypothetical protein EDB19DRAFT_2028446 [Suillus lakei]|nr:hypothetical protein EDB19DRAFT_2028446 [Suillus lakei]
MFDSPMGLFAVSASRNTGKLSTTNVPAHYFISQGYGFPLLDRQQPNRDVGALTKLRYYPAATPLLPLVFYYNVSHDPDPSNAYEGNEIITFDSRAHKSYNISAAVTEKGGKRLRVDALDAQLSDKDTARTVNSRVCISAILIANTIKVSKYQYYSIRESYSIQTQRSSCITITMNLVKICGMLLQGPFGRGATLKIQVAANKVTVLLIGCLRDFSLLEQPPFVIKTSLGRGGGQISAFGERFHHP